MPRVDLTLEIEIERTPKAVQLEGIFDVPLAKRQQVSFNFDVPIENREWQIGAIIGPSGAGKSSVARHMFGDALVEGYEWPASKSVVDGFGDMPVREATAALSAVGFSSPPSWLKPFRVLSNGEQFRATLARALVDARELIVMDEFTSVVDRTVARIGAHAVGKAVRRMPSRRFVAVTCHDDIVNWLQPDWVLEPHIGAFRWRSERPRPKLKAQLVRVDHKAWQWFAQHHYLSATLHKAARCFAIVIDGRPVAFAGLMHFPHPKRKDIVRCSRIVVMPDFQGLGLGTHVLMSNVARLARAIGKTLAIVSSHPALIASYARDSRWRMLRSGLQPRQGKTGRKNIPVQSTHRRTASFHWAGDAWPNVEEARRLWA